MHLSSVVTAQCKGSKFCLRYPTRPLYCHMIFGYFDIWQIPSPSYPHGRFMNDPIGDQSVKNDPRHGLWMTPKKGHERTSKMYAVEYRRYVVLKNI